LSRIFSASLSLRLLDTETLQNKDSSAAVMETRTRERRERTHATRGKKRPILLREGCRRWEGCSGVSSKKEKVSLCTITF